MSTQAPDSNEQDFDDELESYEEPRCERCGGDGMDPWIDYLLPCPECMGEQRL